MEEGDAMLFCGSMCDVESRRTSGKRPEVEQWVEQKGGESCLLLHGGGSDTAV